jgi:UDP-glucose 4-epimerase
MEISKEGPGSHNLVASSNLAERELGWRITKSDLETIVEDAYKWFYKNFSKK